VREKKNSIGATKPKMRKKLLLADDSITIQKVVELTFPSDEFEVVTAGNGRLAVEKAMAFLPDMVLCDVIMPQLDGYQVCEALRASPELKDVPILLLNGAFEPYDAERARAVGALGNVSKPFDPPALVARVKQILAARPSPPVAAAHPDPAIRAYTGETHAYTYDDTEGHPVSTVEVPLDLRALAARSLSLDAPVFTDSEPEVMAAQAEPPDFSETLHDPLEGGPPPQEGLASELVEEMAAMEEFTPIAGTGEVRASGTGEAEFAPNTYVAERELPSTLPPVAPPPAVAPASALFELSPQEHEFEPELDAERTEAAEFMATPEPLDPGPKIAPGAGLAGLATTASSVPASSAVPSAEVAVPVDMVQQIAQRVISQVSERVIHEIAWDVIPGLAEKLIKAEIERIKARAESEHD
jgi:CheY-like chemotaxis protein